MAAAGTGDKGYMGYRWQGRYAHKHVYKYTRVYGGLNTGPSGRGGTYAVWRSQITWLPEY